MALGSLVIVSYCSPGDGGAVDGRRAQPSDERLPLHDHRHQGGVHRGRRRRRDHLQDTDGRPGTPLSAVARLALLLSPLWTFWYFTRELSAEVEI